MSFIPFYTKLIVVKHKYEQMPILESVDARQIHYNQKPVFIVWKSLLSRIHPNENFTDNNVDLFCLYFYSKFLPADNAYAGKKYSMYGHPVDIIVTDKHIAMNFGSFNNDISKYLKT